MVGLGERKEQRNMSETLSQMLNARSSIYLSIYLSLPTPNFVRSTIIYFPRNQMPIIPNHWWTLLSLPRTHPSSFFLFSPFSYLFLLYYSHHNHHCVSSLLCHFLSLSNHIPPFFFTQPNILQNTHIE